MSIIFYKTPKVKGWPFCWNVKWSYQQNNLARNILGIANNNGRGSDWTTKLVGTDCTNNKTSDKSQWKFQNVLFRLPVPRLQKIITVTISYRCPIISSFPNFFILKPIWRRTYNLIMCMRNRKFLMTGKYMVEKILNSRVKLFGMLFWSNYLTSTIPSKLSSRRP